MNSLARLNFSLLLLACLNGLLSRVSASPANVIEIDVKQLIPGEGVFPAAVLSKDGKSVCVWCGLGVKPVRFQVFDLNGERLGDWNRTNDLDLLTNFPSVDWRWRHGKFVADAQFGGQKAFSFSPDLSLGLKVVVPKGWVSGTNPVAVEKWRLSEPTSCIWITPISRNWRSQTTDTEVNRSEKGAVKSDSKMQIPTDSFAIEAAKPFGLINDLENGPIFVNTRTDCGAELDAKTGKILRVFAFGRQKSANNDFSAGVCTYEPNHKWIACGSTRDRRTMVIDASSPDKIFFETYSKERSPLLGGDWSVDSLAFFSDGKYLSIETSFSRRFGPYKHITEIYDTSSWKLVWQSNDGKLESVSITSDGKTMVYIRGAKLVIRPFP